MQLLRGVFFFLKKKNYMVISPPCLQCIANQVLVAESTATTEALVLVLQHACNYVSVRRFFDPGQLFTQLLVRNCYCCCGHGCCVLKNKTLARHELRFRLASTGSLFYLKTYPLLQAPFTDEGYWKGDDPDRSRAFAACTTAMVTLLRSWPGLFYLVAHPQGLSAMANAIVSSPNSQVHEL